MTDKQGFAPIDPETYRIVMRNWVTGVSIVTSKHADTSHGMTVSSFTSVSLSPPLVLVILEMNALTHSLVAASGHFGVSILAGDQEEISDRFAGRIGDHEDRLSGLKVFALATGVPLLTGALANLDCRVVARHEAGTNTIFIGEVVSSKISDICQPLIYFNREYTRLESGPIDL